MSLRQTMGKSGSSKPGGAVARIAVLLLALLHGTAGVAAEVPLPAVVRISAGAFILGSDRAEREAAYLLDEKAYGHSTTRERKWYEHEPARQTEKLPAFSITKNLITNAEYQKFVEATQHQVPEVDRDTWEGYGLVHPWLRTRRFAWQNGSLPEGRGNHPVVLVSKGDAEAYARWLSRATGKLWRLPTENEWEKAARGVDGRRFPWGNGFAPQMLNSHDAGPFDTVPVGSYPKGASPFGMHDSAGQVFEWTATAAGEGRAIVKGGSWDDKGCGVCRPAARHSRPVDLKHILIGFRLVTE